LFDLETDLHEQTNQVDNPEYHESRDQLEKLVADQWDAETLARDIFSSQRRRLFLREALSKGKLQDWDFTPDDELEQHCLRADKVYSQWAYQGILGYHFPEK
jgi:choline-sulfatase